MTTTLPPTGYYWINDPHRYGDEVVYVARTGRVWRWGVGLPVPPETWQRWTFVPAIKGDDATLEKLRNQPTTC